MRRSFLAGVALVVLAAAVAWPAALKLYVKNRPFKEPTTTVGGKIYAPLDSLLQAMGYSWRLAGDQILISKTSGGGPAISAVGNPRLILDGNPLNVGTSAVQGRLFVDAGALARALGGTYRVNQALGSADISFPVAAGSTSGNWGGMTARNTPPSPTPPATSPAAPGGGGTPSPAASPQASQPGKKKVSSGKIITTEFTQEGPGSNKESPIQVTRLDFSDSTVAGASYVGEVRVSTEIKNTSPEDDVNQVTLHLQLVDPNGAVLQEWTQKVGVLKVGATYSFTPEPPVWYNYQKMTVRPKVVVEHEEMPKEVPEGQGTPGAGG
ncbi:MAG TPA: hypothetical protein VNO81_04975 [Candidatus Nitrosotenuis sp.]|jgi:hypothetical protein|nr:hypothetical protein [Candidatus Nitrosotenuis sp.]